MKDGKPSGRYRCNKCSSDRSIFNEAIFRRKISRGQVLQMACLWIQSTPHKSIETMVSVNDKTVKYWVDLFKLSIEWDLKSNHEIYKTGKMISVEIDESKFGKRKNHRGHRVEGVWVVGGVERTDERKMFAITKQCSTKERQKKKSQRTARK
eukprot:gene15484-17338_t